MTIHIYGDSFGVICNHDKTWPAELSRLKKEEIDVKAESGSGPNFSLDLLIADLENSSIKDDDTIIILLSDQKRMEFPFVRNNEHVTGVFRISEDDKDWKHPFEPDNKDDPWPGVQDQSYLNDYKKETKLIAQTLGPMFLYENVKNISFLHLLSLNFKKIKFVVFTCFSLDHYLGTYKNFNINSTDFLHKIKFESLDSENFDYVKIPVGHIVGLDDTGNQLDNHMTPDKNLKFGKLVYDIIMKNEIDKSWFNKQPYDDPFEYQHPLEPIFIYD